MKNRNGFPLLLAAGLLAVSSASAAININTVFGGNAGNVNDESTGYGGVAYGYHIGTYEVTNSQYTAFLNATAVSDPNGLYNTNMNSSTDGGITRAGSSESYTYSTKSGFWDAARFTNWLTSDDTENGVHVLTSTGITNNTITRDATAWANGGVAISQAAVILDMGVPDNSARFGGTTIDNNHANLTGLGFLAQNNNTDSGFTVKAPEDFTSVTLRYAANSANPGEFHVFIDDSESLEFEGDTVVFPQTDGWDIWVEETIVLSGSAGDYFNFAYAGNINNNGGVNVDTIEFTPVPELSMSGLILGVGACFFAFFKRRRPRGV